MSNQNDSADMSGTTKPRPQQYATTWDIFKGAFDRPNRGTQEKTMGRVQDYPLGQGGKDDNITGQKGRPTDVSQFVKDPDKK